MSASISTVSLFVITDENETENFGYCSRLMSLFNKKLSDLRINLNKIHLINKNEFNCIVQLFKLVEKLTNTDYIIVTTTNEKNDYLMQELINNLNESKQDVNKRIFFIAQSNFLAGLAKCFKQLNKTQFIRLDFNDENELQSFLKPLLKSINDVTYSLDTVYLLKNDDILIRNLFINYSFCSIEIEFLNRNLAKTFRASELFRESSLLDDNYINADYYVYEFDTYYKSSLDKEREDIKYLENKIDYDVFLNKLKSSIDIIEESFRRYKSEQICVSFNGGKDCCVVLYLFYAVASRLGIKFPLSVLFINIKHEFEEMKFFVENIQKYYYKGSFQFIEFTDVTKTMKDCLSELKITHPYINSILLGTRRSDGPYFKDMPAFAPTDRNWPEFMRINPILDWTFSEIWFFIRKIELPYCSLYDKGYTSIDSTQNTVKNRHLLKSDSMEYLPAYMLENQDAERESRKKV